MTTRHCILARVFHKGNQPIVGILDLAGEFFAIAGVDIPRAPTLATAIDLDSLAADQTAVASFIAVLQVTADALEGCP